MRAVSFRDIRFFLFSWPLWVCLLAVFLLLMMLHQLKIKGDVLTVYDATFIDVAGDTDINIEFPDGNPVSLPHNWNRSGYRGDNAWYLAKLKLNVPPNRLWGIYIPSVAANASVYLNGYLLGSGGRMADPPARNDFRPLYFAIPNGMLKPGINEIAINLVSDPPGRGFISPLFLGPDETVGSSYKRAFLIRVTVVQFIAISLMISIFYVGVLALKTKDPVYGYFAATLSSLWLFDFVVLIVETPLPGWVLDWLRMQGTGWLVVFMILYLHRFYGMTRPKTERALLFWAISGALLTAIAPIKYFYFLNSYYWDVLTIAWGMYALVVSFTITAKTYLTEHYAMALSVLVLLGAGVRDWVLYTGRPEGFDGTMTLYAVSFALVIFAWVLLHRFTAALNKADSLNRELEHRVQKKEEELKVSYEKMSDAEKHQALTEERERIMRDMHDGIGGHLVSAITAVKTDTQNNLVDHLDYALADLRLMIDSFEPVDDDLGTVLGMMRMRLEKRLHNHDLHFVWQVGDIPEIQDLGPHKVLHVMRILEEAVTNVIKHAQATKITVAAYACELGLSPGVAVDIIDDGIGLPANPSNGYGLNNMQRRTEIIGAKLLMESISTGTRIQLWLPTDHIATETD
jgi:signal transduction histidine kinase